MYFFYLSSDAEFWSSLEVWLRSYKDRMYSYEGEKEDYNKAEHDTRLLPSQSTIPESLSI